MPENITDAYITGDNVTQTTGFLDYLAVTCVALKDANGEIALLYTIDRNLSDEKTFASMRTAISEATGILEEHIIIAATHCHSAVSFTPSWNGVEKYREQYQLAMVTAGESAIADLSPSQLFIGSTQAEDLVFVRHYRLTDGTVVSYSGVTAENKHMVVEHPAQKDAEVQIIRFARPAENKKDVVLVSCANGSEGYLPSTAAMEYGCYEGYITRYERGSGEAFAQEFVDMATQLKSGQ